MQRQIDISIVADVPECFDQLRNIGKIQFLSSEICRHSFNMSNCIRSCDVRTGSVRSRQVQDRVTVYSLITQNEGILTICSDMDRLKGAVEYWWRTLRDSNRNMTMLFIEHEVNYLPEPISMDWAFIDPSQTQLKIDGMCYGGWEVPRHLWGHNLVQNKAYYDAYLDHASR